jgi:hypothetical protein
MLTMQMRFCLTTALFATVTVAVPLYAMNGAAKQAEIVGSSSLASAASSPSIISVSAPQVADAGSGGIAAVAVGSDGDGKESKASCAASSADGDIEAIKKAAEADDPVAINNLGEHYEDGAGVARSRENAYLCYKAAAAIAKKQKGACVHAVINQARCLFDGIGCSVNIVAAHALLKEFWEAGFVEGAICLGFCRANGIGCTISEPCEGDLVDDVQLAEDVKIASEIAKVGTGEDGLVKDVIDWLGKRHFGVTWMACGICGGPFICQDEQIHDRLEAPCCCKHFHQVCAKLWLKKYKTCPGCKSPLG